MARPLGFTPGEMVAGADTDLKHRMDSLIQELE
jgi:hypothetical protein